MNSKINTCQIQFASTTRNLSIFALLIFWIFVSTVGVVLSQEEDTNGVPVNVNDGDQNSCPNVQHEHDINDNHQEATIATAGDGKSNLQDPKKLPVGQLRPWHLPPPVLFSDFETNTTTTLANGNTLNIATGKVTQINAVSKHSQGNNSNASSRYDTTFHVVSGALQRSSVEQVLDLLEQYSFYDDDPDTVDGMPTYELFVDSPDLYKNPGLKYRDTDPNFAPQRMHLRQQLQALLQPYLQDVITPLVRDTYPNACTSTSDRLCTPCYSLIRRYRHGERQSHATHHDGHAIVTVVVSLSDYDSDYRGGLYVSTGYGQEREYLALNKGDAVVHQSTLLHGVKVLDVLDHPETTKRWSWILWYRDSTQCHDYSHEWFAECATQGDPLCQQLHSTKVGSVPGISQEETAHQVLELNQKAAHGGAGMAAVKVARAYLHQLPSRLPFSIAEAQRYFEMAIASQNNPDGHYGMVQLLLQQVTFEQLQQQQQHDDAFWRDKRVTKAVGHLESAALMDHAFSMFNLGMVHTYGYSTGVVNGTLAAEWFAASGLPEGYYLAAQQAKAVGNRQRYEHYGQRAQVLGFMAPWRKQARESTGSGGAAGVNLNLPWPRAMDGRKPPEL